MRAKALGLLLGAVAVCWGSVGGVHAGPLFVANGDRNSIVVYNVPTVAPGTVFVPGGSGGLSDPRGVAIGPERALYVTGKMGNQGHVFRYDGTDGHFIDIFADTVDGSPFGITFGPDGSLYVANIASNSVSRFDGASGALIGTFVSPGSGGLSAPRDMVFGSDGDLYVSSAGSNQVLRYNGSTGAFSGVFASNVDCRGLAFGPDGDLYVANFSNNNIRRFDGATGASRGVFASGGGLDGPVGLVFGPPDALYVSSFNNGLLLEFSGTTGSFVGAIGTDLASPRLLVFAPSRLVNISTRGLVETADDVMIGGFIINGNAPKRVLVRAIGPSLAGFGVPGALVNPMVQLFSGATPIALNDDWQTSTALCQGSGYTCGEPADIAATGLAPANALESAILISLPPGPYTATVSGVGNTPGVGLVEVFEVDNGDAARLVNISTRGLVGAGDQVLIGGFVIGGSSPKKVVVRAIGPSLANFGVPGVLGNPFLRLFSGQTPIAENDDWQVSSPLCQSSGFPCGGPADIGAAGLAPASPQESAIVITLPPGAYTAIMSGVDGTTGVGLVEVFEVP